MRKIHPNKVRIAGSQDSVTGAKKRVSAHSPADTRFWLLWPDGEQRPTEVYVLDEDEAYPEPKPAWEYAFGWIE